MRTKKCQRRHQRKRDARQPPSSIHQPKEAYLAKVTGLVPSTGQVRRVAAGGGLRLVTEVPGQDQEAAVPTQADATAILGSLLKAHEAAAGARGTSSNAVGS